MKALLAFVLLFWVHDFHTSLTEVNYNTKTGSLEISVRVFTDDLEKMLNENKQTKALKIEDEAHKIDPLLEQYFRKNFALIGPNKEVKLAKFYGKEKEADATWLYFEIADCQHITEYTLYNAIFQDMFTDQTNLVNIIYPTAKKTIFFDQKTKISIWPF
jgi:hypothetical protein